MSSSQRIIKYFAMAFAAFLAIMIISGIASVIFSVVRIFPGGAFREGEWKSDKIDVTKSFENVDSLDIDNATGEFKIETGDGFKVEAQNVDKNFKAEVESNGTLRISDEGEGFQFLWFHIGDFGSPNSKITLYVPTDFIAEKADIEAGAGNITIDGLKAEELEVSAGAGNLNGNDITAKKADIEGGVGNINLNRVYLTDATLDSGVGNLNITGSLLGRTDISCGVGEVDLSLWGITTDYGFKVDTGVGNVRLNGEKISGEYNSNTGAENVISIDGGVGNVTIDFEE